MKYAVLHFSYSKFKHFEREFQETGSYSVNLGDYMQTLAVRRLYRRLGIADKDILTIDRETLRDYDGPPAIVVMNACFYPFCFPISPNIHPVFIGFQAKKALIQKNRAFLQNFAPIGCRDYATHIACQELGLASYISGCLTLSFAPRTTTPSSDTGEIICVYGAGAGRFPFEVLRHLPQELVPKVTFMSQRRDMVKFPLSENDCRELEQITETLLNRYRKTAIRIVTPLHHAATPCMASGIPVTLCRTSDDSRFSWLRHHIDIHIAPDFSQVDWSTPAIDVTSIAQTQFADIKARLAHAYTQLTT